QAATSYSIYSYLLVVVSADVVNGAPEEYRVPIFIKDKETFLERLKNLCFEHHGTRVIAGVDLPNCRVTCDTGISGHSSTVSMKNGLQCGIRAVSFSAKSNMYCE
ncbi:secreted salivary gland peptide, putative, partial [Ixodes scapularis]